MAGVHLFQKGASLRGGVGVDVGDDRVMGWGWGSVHFGPLNDWVCERTRGTIYQKSSCIHFVFVFAGGHCEQFWHG